MAREIRIVAHCDVCTAELEPDTGALTIDLGLGVRELDLCPTHTGELYEPLRAVYESAGTRPAGPPPGGRAAKTGAAKDALEEPWVCVLCHRTVGRHRTTVNTHLRTVHDTTRGLVQARTGADLFDGAPLTHWCSCGEGHSSGQALGQHHRVATDHTRADGPPAR